MNTILHAIAVKMRQLKVYDLAFAIIDSCLRNEIQRGYIFRKNEKKEEAVAIFDISCRYKYEAERYSKQQLFSSLKTTTVQTYST